MPHNWNRSKNSYHFLITPEIAKYIQLRADEIRTLAHIEPASNQTHLTDDLKLLNINYIITNFTGIIRHINYPEKTNFDVQNEVIITIPIKTKPNRSYKKQNLHEICSNMLGEILPQNFAYTRNIIQFKPYMSR